jgi:hypothetical protein
MVIRESEVDCSTSSDCRRSEFKSKGLERVMRSEETQIKIRWSQMKGFQFEKANRDHKVHEFVCVACLMQELAFILQSRRGNFCEWMNEFESDKLIILPIQFVNLDIIA